MPILDKIELYFVSAPLPALFSPSWVPGFTRPKFAFYLIRLITADGIEGWSAFPAAGRERAGIGDGLADLFLGRDPTDIDLVHERIRIMAVSGVRNGWIEPAFWDIKAKVAGLPLYKLLGGGDDRLRLYASSGEIKSIPQRCDEAEARLAEGFDTLKVRVHDWDEAVDIAQIQDIARAMQGRMKITVDCNQAFRLTQVADAPLSDLARAKRFADAAADAGLVWVEAPRPPRSGLTSPRPPHNFARIPRLRIHLRQSEAAHVSYCPASSCSIRRVQTRPPPSRRRA